MSEEIKSYELSNKESGGRKIKQVFFADGGFRTAQDGRIMIFHSSFHGEYDIPWVIVMEDDKEIERFNLRLCEGFEWEQEAIP